MSWLNNGLPAQRRTRGPAGRSWMPTTLEAARAFAQVVGYELLSPEEHALLAALEAQAATRPAQASGGGGLTTLEEIEAFRLQMEARGREYDRRAGLPDTPAPASEPATADEGPEGPDQEPEADEPEADDPAPEPSGPAAWLQAAEQGAVDAWIVAKYGTKEAWDRAVKRHHAKLAPGHTLAQADVILAGLEQNELLAARRGSRE